MLAGVCAGLARATNTDPVLFRVVLVVLGFFGGIGILVYLAAWLLIPADDDAAAPLMSLFGKGRSSTSPALTVVLVGVMAIVASGGFGAPITNFPGGLWAVVALVVGVAFLLRRSNQAPHYGWHSQPTPYSTAPAGVGESPTAQYPNAPDSTGNAAAPSAESAEEVAFGHRSAAAGVSYAGYQVPPVQPHSYGASAMDTADAQQQAFAPHGPYQYYTYSDQYNSYQATYAYYPQQKPPKEKSTLGRWTVAGVFVALGLLLGIDVLGASVPGLAYVATALAVVAAGLAVGVLYGRSRPLIVLGLALLLALGGITSLQWLDKNVGRDNSNLRPASVAELDENYEMSRGSFQLDMRDVDFSGHDVDLNVDGGAGEITIIVPDDVEVEANADVAVGHLQLFDSEAGGVGLSRDRRSAGEEGAGTIRINADLGVGDLKILRAADAPERPEPGVSDRPIPDVPTPPNPSEGN